MDQRYKKEIESQRKSKEKWKDRNKGKKIVKYLEKSVNC